MDQNVNMLLGYGDRIQVIDSSGSLIIKMVEKIDMGWYYCRPSNGVGQDPEASAFLNVTCTYKFYGINYFSPHNVIFRRGLRD